MVHRALWYHFHLLIRSNVQNESNSLNKVCTYLTVPRRDAWDWGGEGSMAAANKAEDRLCLSTKIQLRGNTPVYNLGGCLMQHIKMQRVGKKNQFPLRVCLLWYRDTQQVVWLFSREEHGACAAGLSALLTWPNRTSRMWRWSCWGTGWKLSPGCQPGISPPSRAVCAQTTAPLPRAAREPWGEGVRREDMRGSRGGKVWAGSSTWGASPGHCCGQHSAGWILLSSLLARAQSEEIALTQTGTWGFSVCVWQTWS